MDSNQKLSVSRAGWCALPWVLAAAVILLIAQPSIGVADMVIHEKTELVGGPATQGPGAGTPSARESTTYLKGKKIRTESEGHVWIMDFDEGLVITVNPSAKTYTQMTLQDLRETQKQAMEWMASLREQMEKQMQTMPAESREQMRKKLESLPKGMFEPEEQPNIKIKATGKEKTINGFPCKEYQVLEDGELTTVYWLTRSVSTKAYDVYQTELSKWMEGMGSMGDNRLREWEHIRDKGFPIKVQRLKPIMGKVTFDREIFQVEEKSLSESLFVSPKDYKRAEAPALPKPGAQPGPMPRPKPSGNPGDF